MDNAVSAIRRRNIASAWTFRFRWVVNTSRSFACYEWLFWIQYYCLIYSPNANTVWYLTADKKLVSFAVFVFIWAAVTRYEKYKILVFTDRHQTICQQSLHGACFLFIYLPYVGIWSDILFSICQVTSKSVKHLVFIILKICDFSTSDAV